MCADQLLTHYSCSNDKRQNYIQWILVHINTSTWKCLGKMANKLLWFFGSIHPSLWTSPLPIVAMETIKCFLVPRPLPTDTILDNDSDSSWVALVYAVKICQILCSIHIKTISQLRFMAGMEQK